MNELIAQIRAASEIGLYYLALLGALVLPDICGALASEDGTATPAKYKDWLRANVPEQASYADLFYGLRCSLLHQGRAMPHGGTSPVAFLHPAAGHLHRSSTEINGERVDWMSIPIFVEEVTRGVEQWLAQVGDSPQVVENLEKFARLRLEGLPPHVLGPVIA